jgi:chromosome partitioning protein
MKVVTLATEKGGSGKSTLTASLAVAAAEAGRIVVVLDADPQRSLARWHQRRATGDHASAIGCRTFDGASRDPVEGLAATFSGIAADMPDALVLIDTPGHKSGITDRAMQLADLVLLPVRPGIMDYDPVQETARNLTDAAKPFAFCLTQVQAIRAAVVEEAVMELAPYGPMWPDLIGLRADFADAMIVGQGATEYRPKGQAADEVRRLWAWISERLEGVK